MESVIAGVISAVIASAFIAYSCILSNHIYVLEKALKERNETIQMLQSRSRLAPQSQEHKNSYLPTYGVETKVPPNSGVEVPKGLTIPDGNTEKSRVNNK